jgi:[ribosomal protein S5]-alanine N-acetyltransferase
MEDLKLHIIETERMHLRRVTAELNHHVFTHYTDAQIKAFFDIETDEALELGKRRFYEGMTMFNKSFLYFMLAEKGSGKVIGHCGYHTWYTAHHRAEIGYVLDREDMKGRGYMKEAMRPIIQYGFETMKLNRIEAFISPENTASLALVKGLGFKAEGHLREHYCNNGQVEDSLVFGLLKKDFAPGK